MHKQRLKALALEILIGTVLVSAFVAYLFAGGTVNQTFVPVSLNSLIVFGFLVSWFRAAWPEPRFWFALLAMLTLHVAVYVELWHRTGLKFPTGRYILINLLEVGLFSVILDRLIVRTLRTKP